MGCATREFLTFALRATMMAASALNTYNVLNADVMVVAESALNVIDANLTK